jgi:hypothetical protein
MPRNCHEPAIRSSLIAARAATKLGCKPALKRRQLALAADLWYGRKPAATIVSAQPRKRGERTDYGIV